MLKKRLNVGVDGGWGGREGKEVNVDCSEKGKKVHLPSYMV